MANTSLSFAMSPGVYFKETNISQYAKTLSSTIFGEVGVAPRGVLNTRVLSTSYPEFVEKFGFASSNYPALLAAREFFAAGGNQLWFVRVARGDETATTTVPLVDDSDWVVNAINSGSFFNDVSLNFVYTGPKIVEHDQTLSIIVAGSQNFTINLGQAPLIKKTVSLTTTSNVKVAHDNGSGTLVFESGNTGYSGTVDYDTGVISITLAGASSTASRPIHATANYNSTFGVQVLVSPEVVNTTSRNKIAIEEWYNLTPSTFMAKTAKSKYFTVEENPSLFPKPGVYDFSGGDDGADDITDADYVGLSIDDVSTGLQLFNAVDDVDINVIAVPGVPSGAVRQAVDQLCSLTRRDTFGIIDPYPDDTKQSVVDLANGVGQYNGYGTLDSTYLGLYFPYYTSFNNVNGALELTPPSAAVIAAIAQSDYTQAPAGPNRGVITNCLSTAVELDQGARDYLYENRVNPIAKLSGMGIMVLGQRTTATNASALSSVRNRIFLMRIEKIIITALRQLLDEDDNEASWQRATNICQPILRGWKTQGKLKRGDFICNEDTNTNELQDQDTMGCAVILVFTPIIEAIRVNFIISSVSANVTEIPQSILAA